MEMSQEKIGDVSVVVLLSEYLDASVAEEFKRDMAPILESSLKVLVDMSQVQFIDSTGLGALLSCLRRSSAAGGELKLCCTTRPVRAVFELSRMHRIIDITPTREEGLQGF